MRRYFGDFGLNWIRIKVNGLVFICLDQWETSQHNLAEICLAGHFFEITSDAAAFTSVSLYTYYITCKSAPLIHNNYVFPVILSEAY